MIAITVRELLERVYRIQTRLFEMIPVEQRLLKSQRG
jgi:hypothetical protein